VGNSGPGTKGVRKKSVRQSEKGNPLTKLKNWWAWPFEVLLGESKSVQPRELEEKGEIEMATTPSVIRVFAREGSTKGRCAQWACEMKSRREWGGKEMETEGSRMKASVRKRQFAD